MNLALQATEEIVAAAYRICDDGIRRWKDLDIAEWLGLERQTNIRQLIERNRTGVEEHGICTTVVQIPEGAGRPGTEYWLNFEQAMLICTKSETPRAAHVTSVMIKVFSKVVNGGLATAPRMELRAIEVAAENAVRPILLRLDTQDAKIDVITNAIYEMKKTSRSPRRDLTEDTRRIHISIIEKRFQGLCPCCKEVAICCDGAKLPNANDEHFYAANKNGLAHTWITCDVCNSRLIDPEFRTTKMAAFISYQEWVTLFVKETGRDPQRKFNFVP